MNYISICEIFCQKQVLSREEKMTKLKDLLTRDDIKGGEIQVVLTNVGVFRSDILLVEMSGDTVHFKSTKTFKQDTTWTPAERMHHYYPAHTDCMGTHRPQFDITNKNGQVVGWAIIFPDKDSALVLCK